MKSNRKAFAVLAIAAVMSFSAQAAGFIVSGSGSGPDPSSALQAATQSAHDGCTAEGGTVVRTVTTSQSYQFGLYWATVDAWCQT